MNLDEQRSLFDSRDVSRLDGLSRLGEIRDQRRGRGAEDRRDNNLDSFEDSSLQNSETISMSRVPEESYDAKTDSERARTGRKAEALSILVV